MMQDNKIYEFQKATVKKLGCIFTEQRIMSDPSLYVATAIDPRFLLLPFLEKSMNRFSPLDQIVTFVEGCDRIPIQNASIWKLNEICDINDSFGDDMILYKLNMNKTLEWLGNKVRRIAITLKKKRISRQLSSNKRCVDSFHSIAQSEPDTVSNEVSVDENSPGRCHFSMS
jgi:hypothetical protein